MKINNNKNYEIIKINSYRNYEIMKINSYRNSGIMKISSYKNYEIMKSNRYRNSGIMKINSYKNSEIFACPGECQFVSCCYKYWMVSLHIYIPHTQYRPCSHAHMRRESRIYSFFGPKFNLVEWQCMNEDEGQCIIISILKGTSGSVKPLHELEFSSTSISCLIREKPMCPICCWRCTTNSTNDWCWNLVKKIMFMYQNILYIFVCWFFKSEMNVE